MKGNDLAYIKHIVEAIEKIKNYLDTFDYEAFSKNDMVVDATVRELEIIGEAAHNLSKELKMQYPDIPFRDIVDMRNFLIHEYFGVNTKIVWHTCKIDLPLVKDAFLRILAEEDN